MVVEAAHLTVVVAEDLEHGDVLCIPLDHHTAEEVHQQQVHHDREPGEHREDLGKAVLELIGDRGQVVLTDDGGDVILVELRQFFVREVAVEGIRIAAKAGVERFPVEEERQRRIVLIGPHDLKAVGPVFILFLQADDVADLALVLLHISFGSEHLEGRFVLHLCRRAVRHPAGHESAILAHVFLRLPVIRHFCIGQIVRVLFNAEQHDFFTVPRLLQRRRAVFLRLFILHFDRCTQDVLILCDLAREDVLLKVIHQRLHAEAEVQEQSRKGDAQHQHDVRRDVLEEHALPVSGHEGAAL